MTCSSSSGAAATTWGSLDRRFDERPPVADAVVLHAHELDVGAGGDETILQVAAHAVGDGESDDERGDSGGDSGDGDGSDHADDSLPPLGFEVPGRYIELKSHLACYFVVAGLRRRRFWLRRCCRDGRRRAR